MPSSFYKKAVLILLLIFILSTMVACDLTQEEEKTEQVYLNLDVSNTYGVEKLEPGKGRFIYDKGAIAEIEFGYVDSYNFIGWEGKAGREVTKKENDKYIIQMDEDKEIKANLKLKNFKPLEVDFSGLEPFSYSTTNEITDIPHNLESVSIKFNNKLHTDNELDVSIEPKDDSTEVDEIDSEKVEIKDNYININLSDWRDGFYSDDEENNYLEFGNKYTLSIGTNNKNNIFDVKNREIDKNMIINFKVEEPYPEVPGNFTLTHEDGYVEISWLRSKSNAKIEVDEYVKKYIIFRSDNRENIEDEDTINEENVKVININVDYPQENKIIRYEDKEINLSKNEYYYRIKAINSYDNDSKLSEIISTD
ncbi:MAG: hypothetical protein ACOCRO_02370 [Halanaerobiales bacterium]